jgi:FlaA1/EpsC-like NDP-sugar epimerase
MTRFFMTIHEAVSLVLQASLIGEQGDTLVLDMGRPVSILELARTLIQLSGKDEKAVPIQFTGLRQGERLSEELFYDAEDVSPTSFPNIKKARGASQDWSKLGRSLEDLRANLFAASPDRTLARIKQIIPEYSNPLCSDVSLQQVQELWATSEGSSHSKSFSDRLLAGD